MFEKDYHSKYSPEFNRLFQNVFNKKLKILELKGKLLIRAMNFYLLIFPKGIIQRGCSSFIPKMFLTFSSKKAPIHTVPRFNASA